MRQPRSITDKQRAWDPTWVKPQLANLPPLLFTLMDNAQSQSGWLSSIITLWSAFAQHRALSMDLRQMNARFLLSPEICLSNIHHQLQRRGQGKQNEKNNDNNTESGDCDVLKMNGIQSLRALTGRVKLFKWGSQKEQSMFGMWSPCLFLRLD